jgi:hypothetical protein
LRIPTRAGGVEVEVQLLHERERLTQFITIVEKLEFKKFNIIISITSNNNGVKALLSVGSEVKQPRF